MAARDTTGALLSLREASGLLGISTRSLYRLLDRGGLPVVEIGGRTLIDPADLRELIESRKRRRGP